MRGLLARPSWQEFPLAGSAGEEDSCLVTLAKANPRDFAPLYNRYFDPVDRDCYCRLAQFDSDEGLGRCWIVMA